ncbi:FecR family protein [Burkholderia cepacia]|uniref:FecR family protein n=1 Tax=Burkholderia cepacia TaxID=292 RepID=UPI000F5A3AF7|nr:FecR domain-containing protein [Burkholderia cepacia]RQT91794.1 DUF4974 domain-containing protein [Burkholderia cepacia]
MTQDTRTPGDLTEEEIERLFARAHGGDPQQEHEARCTLEAWADGNPQRRAHLEDLSRSHATITAAAASLRSRYPRVTPSPVEPVPVRVGRHVGRRIAYASTLSAVLAVGVWTVNPVLSQQSFETSTGERRTVVMDDGSQVNLNTRTRLTFANRLRSRETVLAQGEAFFQVVHSSLRPFTVEANGTNVRVVGTRFNVRYQVDGTQVAVEHGKVEVTPEAAGHPVLLTDGYSISTRNGTLVGMPRVGAVDMLTAWRQGRLEFSSTPISEVVAQIQRYRERPIEIRGDAVGKLTLTGSYPLDNPDALLRLLPRVLPVSVRFTGDGTAIVAAR